MTVRIGHKYIPIQDRSNFGQLQFPTLKDNTPLPPVISDLKSENVAVSLDKRNKRSKKVSKSNRRLSERLGAASEFRLIRYNISYTTLLDVIGEDFPLHPEYLYVIDIILQYYGVNILDLLEMIAYREQTLHTNSQQQPYLVRTFNLPTASCLSMLMYFLYVQYKCNPAVIMQVFGMSILTLRTTIDKFFRTYDNSVAVRADYSNIHGKLLELQPLNH